MKFPPIDRPDLTHIKEKRTTTPWDPRFPNQNQTKHCYVSYLDLHRCTKIHGPKYDACLYFKQAVNSMCPSEWVEKWEEQRGENRFPGRI